MNFPDFTYRELPEPEERPVYRSVGVEIAQTADNQVVVSILFPTPETTGPDGPFEAKSLTLPAAKALLLDMKDAIEYAMKILSGIDDEDEEGA